MHGIQDVVVGAGEADISILLYTPNKESTILTNPSC